MPNAFRRLPNNLQAAIRQIYYSKDLKFEEKISQLDIIIKSLPKKVRTKLVFPKQKNNEPIKNERLPTLSKFVEFDVPVLLHFNGKIVRKFLYYKYNNCF